MEALLKQIDEFRKKRDWHLVDTPANLSKSIVVEAAELLEHFQWNEQKFDSKKVQDELADVLMYAFALCIELGVAPKQIIEEKLVDVARRYPEK